MIFRCVRLFVVLVASSAAFFWAVVISYSMFQHRVAPGVESSWVIVVMTSCEAVPSLSASTPLGVCWAQYIKCSDILDCLQSREDQILRYKREGRSVRVVIFDRDDWPSARLAIGMETPR